MSGVLHVIGFERLGLVLSDLYFVDPHPAPGQEGAERGVRMELRLLEAGELQASIYSARPIAVDRPIWRVDLLETADGPYGSFDRTHHHPYFRGWDPCPRQFVPELSADPVTWVAGRLAEIDGVLEEARVDRSVVGATDVDAIRAAAPDVIDALQRLLDGVHAGRLALAPAATGDAERISWL